MDYAIGANDVGFDNLGLVDGYAICGSNRGFCTIDGLDLAGLDVCGHDFTCDDVVGENAGQLGFVFWLQETLDGACRELGESFVGWGEDGEWAFTAEGFRETGGLDCCYEGREVFVASGDFNDVFGGLFCLGSNRSKNDTEGEDS